MKFKNFQLIISSLIVGLAYGIAPNKLFPELFGIKVEGGYANKKYSIS